MNGLQLLEKTFRLEEVERVPWVPFVGVHGGRLIGADAETYLKSPDRMIEGLKRAIELYNPDGIPVSFDLQIEAEILGCELAWSGENPPAVITHPLAEGKKLADLKVPTEKDGRIPIILETAGAIRKSHPDIAVYGLITGPFTLALHLLGTDIFIKIFEDPAYVTEIMEFCTKVGMEYSRMLMDAGCDVIAVVDPMTSQIDPASFEAVVSPHASKIFAFIREQKKYSSFFVCGHAQQNIEVMCDCKPDNVSIDENIPLDYVRDVCIQKGLSFGGNMKLTVVLLMGSEEDCQSHAMECMELGGKRGFILAPGCDLPMDTPAGNLQAVTEIVHDPYKQDVVRAMERTEEDLVLPDMADYGQTDKVIVDIITLDSESCAPCQYMVEAVKRIAPEFEGIIEWREHSIKQLSAVTFMNALMVKNLPTICIDGKIAFTSQIPPRQELIAAIQKRINQKLRLRIREKKAEVLILGNTEEECAGLEDSVRTGMLELGVELQVKKITGEEQIRSYGISRSPAVLIVDYKVKSQGSFPSHEVVKEWIKEVM
jgi:uroporphyrinogen decarboxylase